MKKVKIIISILIGVLIFYIIIKDYSFDNLRIEIYNIQFLYLSLGFFSLLLSFCLLGLRWVYLFPEYTLSLAFNGAILSIAANSIIPARGGELIRSLFFQKQINKSLGESLAQIIIERMLDSISIISFLIISILIIGNILSSKIYDLIIIGFFLIILIFILIGIYRKRAKKIDQYLKIITVFLRISRTIVEKGKDFLNIFKEFESRKIIVGIIFSILISLAYILSLWFFLLSVGINISVLNVIAIFPLINLAIALPVSVGYLGVFHAALIYSLSIFGIKGNQIIGKVILIHLMIVLPPIIYGWWLISTKGLKFWFSEKESNANF